MKTELAGRSLERSAEAEMGHPRPLGMRPTSASTIKKQMCFPEFQQQMQS